MLITAIAGYALPKMIGQLCVGVRQTLLYSYLICALMCTCFATGV
jgi:hypothetical protein